MNFLEIFYKSILVFFLIELCYSDKTIKEHGESLLKLDFSYLNKTSINSSSLLNYNISNIFTISILVQLKILHVLNKDVVLFHFSSMDQIMPLDRFDFISRNGCKISFKRFSNINHQRVLSAHHMHNLAVIYLPKTVLHFEASLKYAVKSLNKTFTDFTRRKSMTNIIFMPQLLFSNQSIENLTYCDIIKNVLGNISKDIYMNTKVFVNTGRWATYEIYSIKNEFYCQLVNLSIANIPSILIMRQNFRQQKIISSAAVEFSTMFEARWEYLNGSVVNASGSAVNIFKDLSFMLNFTCGFVKGDWFSRNLTTGKLYGLSVDQLRDGSADLYITQTTLASYRAYGFSYIQPTFKDGLFAFIQQPPSSSAHDVHISPFTLNLWLTIFIFWLLLTISFYKITETNYILAHISVFESYHHWDNFEKFQESLLWAIGSGCIQGWYNVPKSISARIVLFSGACSGLFLYIIYSGAIISSLTSETLPIKNFDDLIQSNIPINVDKDSSTIYRIVEHLKNTTVRRSGFSPVSEEEGILTIILKPGAHFGFSRNFYHIASVLQISPALICDKISKIPILKLPLLNGMLVPKFSPYREAINNKIILLMERGGITRINKQYQVESTLACDEKKMSYRENLGLLDVITPFSILAFGIILSTLIFIFESTSSFKLLFTKRNPS